MQGLLKANGYRTLHVGKAHLGPDGHSGSDPVNVGFDVNIGGTSQGSPGSYRGTDHYMNHGKQHGPYRVPHLEAYHGTDTFLTEALTIEAIKEIKKAVSDGQPFFLHMAHYALHTPWMSDPRFAENYQDSKISQALQSFATLVEGMDKSLGDIMYTAENLGIAENTLVIFLGDNGSDARIGNSHEIGSSAPLRGKKATHYEGGTRVPFIAAWVKPDSSNLFQKKLPIAQNQIQTQAGTIMDIYPTILNLTDIKSPEGHITDGYDLAPLFTGNPDPSREINFLMHFPHDHRSQYFTSLRQGDWKVIYHYFPGESNVQQERYQLFHLKKDPGESVNLVGSEPEKLAAMMQHMIRQLEAEQALYCEKDGQEIRPLMP